MLIIAKNLKEISFSALMSVYEEGNRENARELWPDLNEGQGVLMAEQAFYQYLREQFFPLNGTVYCLWAPEGAYRSALRLEPYRDGLLLEALETAPEYRRYGYASCLLEAVLEHFGEYKIYSHVGKRNIASLRTHQKCGFRRCQEYAVYIDGSVNDRCCTMLYDGLRRS